MLYIVHHRYRGKTCSAKEVNLPRGTICESAGPAITLNGAPICYNTSEVGHKFFARNDDGYGLCRGALTYEIAYSNRERFNKEGNRRQRFTDEEIEMLERDWSKYLIPDIDVILFNHDFFNHGLCGVILFHFECSGKTNPVSYKGTVHGGK